MENKYCVYKHTAPNGKVYIGITRRAPNIRWGLDGKRYKNNCHFYNAIQKYGWDNFDHEVLFEGLSAYQAGEKEKELIKLYDSATPAHGYNNTHGGEHGKMADHINEENRRRGKALLGEKNPFFGRKHTDESKARMRKARLSRPDRFKQSREASEKSARKTSKKVSQYSKNGTYLATFDSCCEAARVLTGKRNGGNHIGAACAGKRKTAYGYLWKFEKDIEPEVN